MKRIEAYIRVHKLEEVKLALEDIGVNGMSCEQVKGYGRQQGRTDLYRGSTYAQNLVPKMRIEIVVHDDKCDAVVNHLVKINETGEPGDGKIFVYDVLDAIRIRTNERGDAAVT